MIWDEIINDSRLYESASGFASTDSGDRSSFERDYDRILFSYPFRKLQDKTQVIPFPESDFVHTRLTHSLETSVVGRSLGKAAGKHILESNSMIANAGFTKLDIGFIVSAACLAHDIGNPPFGHTGEQAISEFFLSEEGASLKKLVVEEAPNEIEGERRWGDLIDFEGNANGFRILTKNIGLLPGGMQLTLSTLAAYTKYPKASLPVGDDGCVFEKKHGLFSSDLRIFRDIAKELGIPNNGTDEEPKWSRHPFAYLVEASDDICYNVIDFEDGIHSGLIDFKFGEGAMKDLLRAEINEKKYSKIKNKEGELGYLRSKLIHKLIDEVTVVFVENENDLLSGTRWKSLIDDCPSMERLREIKTHTKEKVYNSRRVLEIESAGFQVLPFLIESFVEGLGIKKSSAWSKNRREKIRSLLPKKFNDSKYIDKLTTYEKLLEIVEYIAGMTDSYASTLYSKMTGVNLPSRFS